MIFQMPWGRERVNTIRNKRPEWPQHILNYSWIDRHHASWAFKFLPKNKPNLGEVTIFFLGSDRTPPTHSMFGISVSPPPCHQLISLNHGPFTKSSKNRTRICRMQQSRNAVKSSLVQWQLSSIVRQRLGRISLHLLYHPMQASENDELQHPH